MIFQNVAIERGLDVFECLDVYREDWASFWIKKKIRELKNEDLV